MTWSMAGLVGQEEVVERLVREAAADRMAHAYMFEGPTGCGKTTLARAVAAMRLCPETASGHACGVCKSCHMLQSGNHPDYLELPREPAELRLGRFVERSASTEAVEHQPLLPFLRLKPVEGGSRVAVIPDAERMRSESANAFLKTLEEPPGRTLILLTVNNRDRLPATIVSRCRRMGVAPLPAPVLAAELEKRDLAHGDDALALALTAEGSLGEATQLAGGGVPEFWRWLCGEAFANPGAVSAQRLADALASFGEGTGDNAGKRKNALRALDLTALSLRRLLRLGLEPERGARALAALWEAGDRLGRNVRPELVLLSAAFSVMAALRGTAVRELSMTGAST